MANFRLVAAKFGGTSVENAVCIANVCDIVKSNPNRRVIVVSAPAGMTNQLLAAYRDNIELEVLMGSVRDRFADIVKELQVDFSVDDLIETITSEVSRYRVEMGQKDLHDYVVSRGEWMCAQIVARVLDYDFVDALDFIVVDSKGTCKLDITKRRATSIRLLERARKNGVVMGGFYGRASSGRVRPALFSRGGSDISGAIAAVVSEAEVYENWTDVEGVYAADPRIVTHPRKNDSMTYKELRELTFMGAKVFHEDAVAIVRGAGIPIHVRSTLTPEKNGTLIADSLSGKPLTRVTGVAGKNGFSIVTIEKYGMDDEIGILSRAANVFTKARIGVNVSSSIDSLTFIVESDALRPVQEHLVSTLMNTFQPDDIRVEHDIALVCTVGEGMRNTKGVSATVDNALANAGINIILELQGGSQINIIRGVKESDFKMAIEAIYKAFFP